MFWRIYFCRNFQLWLCSHLNELSKLPSQQLGTPGCHFEKGDLISSLQNITKHFGGGGMGILTDNWDMSQFVAMKIYLDMLSLVLM